MVHLKLRKALKIEPDIGAYNVDPDETAHHEPSHQDLHCLPFCFDYFLSLVAIIDMSKFSNA